MQVKNWNLNDLVLQMTYAAAQAVQSVPQPAVSDTNQKSESGNDFRTLLETKQTEHEAPQTAVSSSSETPTNEAGAAVPTDNTAVAQNAAALVQPELLTMLDQSVQSGVQTQVPQQVQSLVGEMEILPETEAAPVLPTMQQATQTAVELPVASAMAETADMSQIPVTTDPAASLQPNVSTQTEAATTAPETDAQLPEQVEVTTEYVDSGRRQEVEPEEVPVQTTDGAGQTLFQSESEMPQRVGDAPVLDAESEDFPVQLGKTLRQAVDNGSSRVEVRLTPANLGTVTVEMEHSPEGVLRVVLHAENPQTAKLLSEHSGTLGLMLQSGRQDEVRVEVPRPQQDQQPQRQMDQDGSHGQNGRQQERQQQNTDPERFLQQLRLGLLPISEQ